MHEAVIVSTATTAIATAFKDSSVDVDGREFGTRTVDLTVPWAVDLNVPWAVDEAVSQAGIGRPVARTGSRMVVSPIRELRRRSAGTGVATMCTGGGMAAVVLDVSGG